jgi:thiol-disulfide isomerase/thioredoxin
MAGGDPVPRGSRTGDAARWAVLVSLPLLASAFAPSVLPGEGVAARGGMARSGGICAASSPDRLRASRPLQTQRHRGVAAAVALPRSRSGMVVGGLRMDAGETEAPVVCKMLKAYDSERGQAIVDRVQAQGAMIAMLWTKDFCRKCMAITPKFSKLTKEFKGRNVVFVEMPTGKISKEMRLSYDVKVAPTMTLVGAGGVVEAYIPGKDLSRVPADLQELIAKHVPETETQQAGFAAMIEELYATDVPPTKEKSLEKDLADTMLGRPSARVVRAPGISEPKGTQTVARVEGATSESILRKLQAVPTTPANGAKGGGGSSTADLLAQLKAAEEKKGNQ